MIDLFTEKDFKKYFFGSSAVLLHYTNPNEPLVSSNDYCSVERDWAKEIAGAYYIKPNYPGRCSHVCNSGFLVPNSARGKGMGNILAQSFLKFAPALGYRQSVFNLVFEVRI